ncbi:MAG: PIN domain-containing protein [Oscillospiraceae bacterium]|nr:PIN domain-containing protein [Oscillospiraceae bacterium]
MIIVDSSVIIDFLKGDENPKTIVFESVLKRNLPYGIASYTVQEILQGAKNENEYGLLKDYLSTLTVYFLPERVETYEKAARLYYELRRKGVTLRSSIDILISLIAIENNFFLLHNDKDFDMFAANLDNLKILEKIL